MQRRFPKIRRAQPSHKQSHSSRTVQYLDCQETHCRARRIASRIDTVEGTFGHRKGFAHRLVLKSYRKRDSSEAIQRWGDVERGS